MCHVGFEEPARRTKNLEPNPHENHYIKATEPECTECHQSHSENILLCDECHIGMKIEPKQ